ncbi:MAG TPA: asparagine synthase (glutamine-hydrolyzing), partial [Gallionella sp.]|nr:asparagine synthase (glutamine-hydrolyzing) [Gallionella sp.]
QPMHDPETGNWIVFNGEIYNHAMLREQLNRDGIVTRSHSDTEVLLKLYGHLGPGMMNMLRGMFGFAIWDARKRQMFLARGPLGVKPLYIADDGKTLRFASQVKALLAGQVDTRPEPAGHAGFLLWGSVPDPYTLYRGIRAVPAGHWMLVADGVVGEPVCYNNPTLGLRNVARAGPDDTDAALRQIAAAVHDSVAAHMVSDVPVGVFLSSGLDSTMIAACAASLGTLRTLTLGFEEYSGTVHDEAALASEVAQSLGASHTLHRISAADFARDREQLLAAMDQPSIDGVNTWFVAKAAAQQGLKVALSGIGGDELFGSYPGFSQIPRLRKALEGLKGLPLLGRIVRKGLSPFTGLLPSAKYAGLLEYGTSLEGAYLLRRALFMPWEIGALMDPEMAAEGLKELDTLSRLRATTNGLGSERIAISALEIQWYMKNQLLRDADWAGMAHSLEIRVPLLDMPLFEKFVEIPGLDATQEKRMIARTVAPNLPEAVLNRPKSGFAVPTHQWLHPDAQNTIINNREWALMLYRSFTQP